MVSEVVSYDMWRSNETSKKVSLSNNSACQHMDKMSSVIIISFYLYFSSKLKGKQWRHYTSAKQLQLFSANFLFGFLNFYKYD